MMSSRAVIFGGAGFLGSHVAERLVAAGWEVTVVDGLLTDTGGSLRNLAHLQGRVRIIDQRVENVPDLRSLLAGSDVAVDAMAWTAHLLALERPCYDLELNVSSHLALLEALCQTAACRAIFLGSSGQYGNIAGARITEETPMVPVDIQGIHKLTAESYYRVFAAVHRIRAISLRIPNCFGERQPAAGPDIGLVGGFVRDALAARTIEVYGRDRYRTVAYAGDVAEIVVRCAAAPFEGFQPFNTGGHHLLIAELAALIVELAGCGACTIKPVPNKIRAIDTGGAEMVNRRLAGMIGALPVTDLRMALARAVAFFKEIEEREIA